MSRSKRQWNREATPCRLGLTFAPPDTALQSRFRALSTIASAVPTQTSIPFICTDKHEAFGKTHTSVNVELLLPPRQSRGISHLISAGLGAVIGTLVGDFIFMVAAVAGLAVFMNANPYLFQGLRWFGPGYLCWMGLQLLRAPVTQSESGFETRKSGWGYFRQACMVSLTNPKVILCFVAIFPLFMRPPGASTMTLVAMMAHVTVISSIYQACIVMIGIADSPA